MAPIGAAFKIIPIMVEIKMANKCHASGESPFGTGINQITKPIITVIIVFFILISFMILYIRKIFPEIV
jgi:hypothetical protein